MKKITCPVCKEELELGKNFCPECGYKFEYSTINKEEQTKEEKINKVEAKKLNKTNHKEEKRIAIHFIFYAIVNIISKGIINSYLIAVFRLGYRTIIINPITKQYTNPIPIILNGIGTLYLISILALSVTKNKALNIIGTILNFLYITFAIVIYIFYFLLLGHENFVENIPYMIIGILPLTISLIIQIIYIVKKRD